MNIPKPVFWLAVVMFVIHYVMGVLACVYLANEARAQSARVTRDEWRNEETALANDVCQAFLDGKINFVENHFLERGSPALVNAVLNQ